MPILTQTVTPSAKTVTPNPFAFYPLPREIPVSFTIQGASGGNSYQPGSPLVFGGLGGLLTGTITVPNSAPSNAVGFYAGDSGGNIKGQASVPISGGLGGSGLGPPTFIGQGGNGGTATGPGGGGGGSSQIIYPGIILPLLVAGGGGGAGGTFAYCNGELVPANYGAGGSSGPVGTSTAGAGGRSTCYFDPSKDVGGGGNPGLTNQGGSAGQTIYQLPYTTPASAGTQFNGGNGGGISEHQGVGGGGGGGGEGGGGGGASVTSGGRGAGGGAGSNYISSNTTGGFNITITSNTVATTGGPGFITFSYITPGPTPPATPTLSFSLSALTIPLGSSTITNQVISINIANGNSPTGILTANLYADASGTNFVSALSVSVTNGNGTYVIIFPVSSFITYGAGIYSVQVIYSGDQNNNNVIVPTLETFTVTKAQPTIISQACYIDDLLPSSYCPKKKKILPVSGIRDRCNLQNSYQATGTLLFSLYQREEKSENSDNCDCLWFVQSSSSQCRCFKNSKKIFSCIRRVKSDQSIYYSSIYSFDSSCYYYDGSSISLSSFTTTSSRMRIKVYFWIISYSGDDNNYSFITSFHDPAETLYLLCKCQSSSSSSLCQRQQRQAICIPKCVKEKKEKRINIKTCNLRRKN